MMKKTTCKQFGIVSVCLLCLLAVMAMSITACTRRANTGRTMNIEFGDSGMIRNGTECHTYQVEKGQTGTISIRISRVSGRLDMDIFRAGNQDDPDYTGRDLDSASFDVIVEEPGEYQIWFTADDFVGEYGISWSTEEITDK